MIDYIRKHDRYVSELLEKNPGQEALRELLTHHDKQIAWMQHESLAHLMTMLFVCLFFLLAFGFTMIHFVLPYMLLTALLLILSVAYILHYYRLENSIQRWYVVSNRIRDKLLQSK
jgi:Ca2+/Na+ antiporter